MEATNLVRYAGWAAYLSAAATVVGFVTLGLFFTAGEPFGVINDITSIVHATSMIPLALVLVQLNRANSPTVAFVALAMGVLAMLAAAALQAMLVLRLVRFELTLTAVPVAFGFIGLWLLINSLLSRSAHSLPETLNWLGVMAGTAYLLVILGFILGGQQHPLAIVGGLAAVIGYPVWAIWFGRLLLSGKVAA